MAAVVLSAGRLQVGFEHRADRHAHWIGVRSTETDSDCQRWLESIEGNASESWPASPALQSLHVEDRGNDVRVALLVGMAGGSHWSVSVEADASRGQLTFDVACRTRQPPVFLGSSYRLISSGAMPRYSQRQWRLPMDREWIDLEIDDTVDLAEIDVPDVQSLRIAVSPSGAAEPRTYRWRYRLRHGELIA